MHSSALSFSSPRSNALEAPYLHSLLSSSQAEDCHGVPTQFLWPAEDIVCALDELHEPLIDLDGFFRGDNMATLEAAKAIGKACMCHGFFQVVSHGIDPGLIQAAHDQIRSFFMSPIETKLRATKMKSRLCGYSSAHSERFSSKLPWKETLSFVFTSSSPDEEVVDFFKSNFGPNFEHTGKAYQKYCEAMKDLALGIMELLAISLGVERLRYREFFEDSCSIMRCNYYPPCKVPSLVLGTGPHCDPNSLTILHQDQVGGLEVFVNDKWHKVRPLPNALVINIGDTFMAMSNGRYKSCLHRAAVHESKERMSLAFFFSPALHQVVRPPQDLLRGDHGAYLVRKYPDFTWSDFLRFAKENYRVDGNTLLHFSRWLLSRSPVSSLSHGQDTKIEPETSPAS